MLSEELSDIDDVLSNLVTLRILLHLKQERMESIGTREMQRLIGVKSPSTITWHYTKLMEVGLIYQDDSGRYLLTTMGRNYDNIHIPYFIKTRFFKRYRIPFLTYLITIQVIGIVIIFIQISLGVSLFFSLLLSISVLIISTIVLIKQWNNFRIRYNEFYN